MLLKGLPPEAASRRDHEWSRQDEFMAALVSRLDFWERQHAIDRGHKKNQLPTPPDIRRPGEEQPKRRKPANREEVKRFFRNLFSRR